MTPVALTVTVSSEHIGLCFLVFRYIFVIFTHGPLSTIDMPGRNFLSPEFAAKF